jgi:endonuclease/exonuclease/phosphatase family metal-dependent hydrolase
MHKTLALLTLLLITACGTAHGELRVLSYNIRHGADINWEMRFDEQVEFVASRNADLISLQEVDINCERSGNIDEAQLFADKMDMQPVFQKFIDLQGGTYGIAALSKLAISKVEPKFYTAGGEPRNFPLLHIELDESEVLFVPLHFDWVKDNTVRKKQAQELIADLDKSGMAVILAGDFNALPNSETMDLFSAAGFSFKTGKLHTFHGSKGDDISIEIDFIAVRGNDDLQLELLQTVTIEQRELSDHAAVEAQIRWQQL